MKVRSDISYLRGITSCLPGAGPFLSLYNVIATKIDRMRIEAKLEANIISAPSSAMNYLIEEGAALISGKKELSEVIEDSENKVKQFGNNLEDLHQTRFELLKREMFFSGCGTVSNFLTAAATVVFLALGILSGPLGASLTAGFSLLALGNYVNFSKAKEALDAIPQKQV